LLELDTNSDEDLSFNVTHYNLPVMVKDPDIESESIFQRVKDEFHQLGGRLSHPINSPNTPYKEYLDVESWPSDFIVYNLTPQHGGSTTPTSTYIP